MRVLANVAYKFRIYPSQEQKTMFAKTFGLVRLVYNRFLNRRIKQYEKDKTSVSYIKCAKEMAEMKKSEDYSFLKYKLKERGRRLVEFNRFFANSQVCSGRGYKN